MPKIKAVVYMLAAEEPLIKLGGLLAVMMLHLVTEILPLAVMLSYGKQALCAGETQLQGMTIIQATMVSG